MSMEPPVSNLGGAPALLPVLVSTALLLAGERVRDGRRRRALNASIHELRRPLQALALTTAPSRADRPDSLELALAALRDLDREVNGGGRETLNRRPVDARGIAVAACDRWRARAARSGRRIVVRWRCGPVLANVDPTRVSQALDNLIANALEHGGGPISIEACRHGDRIDLIVRDSGPKVGVPARVADPRRGHGLRVTRRLARLNGGSLRMRRGEGRGTSAALVLPLAPELPARGSSPHHR